jgi:Tfp pilus assembly protein PilO
MTKLRNWILLGAVGCIALAAAGWFLLISPQRSHEHSLNAQTAAQQQRIEALRLELQTKLAEQRNLPQQEVKLAELQAKVPATPALPSLIRQLVIAAGQAGVDLSSIQPSDPTFLAALADTPAGTTSSGVLEVPLTLQIKGTYFNVEEFFSNLQSLTRTLLVSGFSITDGPMHGTGSPQLQVSITARAFMTNPNPTAAGTGTTGSATSTSSAGSSTTSSGTTSTSAAPSSAAGST